MKKLFETVRTWLRSRVTALRDTRGVYVNDDDNVDVNDNVNDNENDDENDDENY